MGAPLTAKEVIEVALERVRKAFYEGQTARFGQDRAFLIRALTYPARWLKDLGAALPPSWYAKLLRLFLDDVEAHATGEVKFFPGYLLKVAQSHMRLQGHRYYEAGKSTGLAVQKALQVAKEGQQSASDCTTILSEMHRLMSGQVKQQRGKGGREREKQRELF